MFMSLCAFRTVFEVFFKTNVIENKLICVLCVSAMRNKYRAPFAFSFVTFLSSYDVFPFCRML